MKLKGLNAFFGNSKVLLIAFIIFFVSKTYGLLNLHINSNMVFDMIFLIVSLLIVMMVIGLFLAYVFHESNIQKSLISNIYLLQIIHLIIASFVSKIANGTQVNVSVLTYYLGIIETVLWIVSYVIHLIMLSDKTGKNRNIKINQIVFFAIFIIEIIMHFNVSNKIENIVQAIVYNGFVPLFLLVCIETKIGIYKRTRLELKEKGKWDDKAKAKTKEIFNLF